MDCHRLADDQPIFDQLSDLLTGVGIGDFIGLIGDTRGEPLLKPEHTHGCGRSSKRVAVIVAELSVLHLMSTPSNLPTVKDHRSLLKLQSPCSFRAGGPAAVSTQHNSRDASPINYNTNSTLCRAQHAQPHVPFLTMSCCLGIFPAKFCYF
uniref:Uncharacterized protein n=1 Tax=Theropithecus gelada TaxID=9565 RepID=A0A8D2EXH1_THEGE